MAAAAVLATSIGLVLSSGGRTADAKVQPSAPAPARQAARLRPADRPVSRPAVPENTELATVLETAPRYAAPGRLAAGTVPASWYERPSVLPVIATRPGWVRVRLAQRPDGSTAWLPAGDVTLSSTPYRIVVDLATTRLALYDHGRLVFSAPAGVGAEDDPTPTGEFFVAFDEPPPEPNPGYGPFIIVTSDHSQSISDWEGSGDAVIGIHGPLGEDSEIGTSGAKISHGCIRLHDEALEQLADVPPGTPIDVIG
jgi:lipoprotein-anchoring transpeptidase ErfK/SrfK